LRRRKRHAGLRSERQGRKRRRTLGKACYFGGMLRVRELMTCLASAQAVGPPSLQQSRFFNSKITRRFSIGVARHNSRIQVAKEFLSTRSLMWGHGKPPANYTSPTSQGGVIISKSASQRQAVAESPSGPSLRFNSLALHQSGLLFCGPRYPSREVTVQRLRRLRHPCPAWAKRYQFRVLLSSGGKRQNFSLLHKRR
jgi:hypothetical protein